MPGVEDTGGSDGRRPEVRPRTLLLNPPYRHAVFRDHYCASEAKSAYLWQPLDLQIQGAALAGAGHALLAIDAVAAPRGDRRLAAEVRRWRPDGAVVLVARRTWDSDRRVLDMLRAEGVSSIAASGDFLRFGEAPIDEASGRVDLVLTDFTTPHLAASFEAGRPAGPGVATLEDVRAGRSRDMGRAPLHYPCPDHRLFGLDRYRLPYPGFRRFASVLTGYGCPFHCLYCHVGELGYRLRPVPAIVEEVAAARAAGARCIYFRDATINARRKHLVAWCEALIEGGLALPWAGFATARPLDDELAALMWKSGCRHLQIGVETLVDELRDDNGKPFDGAAHREFVEICHRHHIEVTAHLVLGLPGETESSLARTVEGLADSGFDYVAVNLAEQRPGVPWSIRRGVELAVEPGAAPPEALVRWRKRAYRRFYLRPRRLARELLARVRHRDLGDAASLGRDVARWLTG